MAQSTVGRKIQIFSVLVTISLKNFLLLAGEVNAVGDLGHAYSPVAMIPLHLSMGELFCVGA